MASEKRLIDANALGIGKAKREAFDNPAYADGWNSAIEIIENAPTVDAVEVVRCKDCKHWLKDVPGCTDFVGRCEWARYMVGAVGYCVYGEKKVDSETKQSCTYNKNGHCMGQKMMPECDAKNCDRRK